MSRYLMILIALCALLSTNLFAASLVNLSFETGAEAPESWTPLTKYIGQNYLWDTTEVFSGVRSLSIRATRYRYGRWRSDASPAENEGYTWYTLSGMVKTQRNNGEVYLCIAWLDEEGLLIITSDSQMLAPGDNDWQTVTVSALPPAGAVDVSFWCLSNHNSGTTWFDDLALTLTRLPATQTPSYDGFLIDHPTHPLVVDAHLMRVMEIYTQAKWTKEKGVYDSERQKQASALFAQAAAFPRLDNVLARVVAPGQLPAENKRFETLIDKALWQAAVTAHDGRDVAATKRHLRQIVGRNHTPEVKQQAQTWLDQINLREAQPEGGR